MNKAAFEYGGKTVSGATPVPQNSMKSGPSTSATGSCSIRDVDKLNSRSGK
jgi:hypothetical protein